MIVIFRAAGRQTVGCIQPRETILKSQPGGSVGWMWPSRAVKLGGVRITAEMPPGSDGPSTTFIRNAGIDLNAGCSCLTTAISAISIGTTTGSSSGGGNTILGKRSGYPTLRSVTVG